MCVVNPKPKLSHDKWEETEVNMKKEIFNQVSKVIQNCFGFALICCDWFIKLAPLSQPIRWKGDTNLKMVARAFPRFRQLARFYLEFSLAPQSIFLSVDRLFYLLWFWSSSAKLKQTGGLISTLNQKVLSSTTTASISSQLTEIFPYDLQAYSAVCRHSTVALSSNDS